MNQRDAFETIRNAAVHDYLGLPTFMRPAFAGIDIQPLGAALIEAAKADDRNAHLLLNISLILFLSGHQDLGLSIQSQAIALQRDFRVKQSDSVRPIRLIALFAAGHLMDNTPIEFLTEQSNIELWLHYLDDQHRVPDSLPPHDAIFVAVGESDANRTLLESLIPWCAQHQRPVFNHPENILALSRDSSSRLAANLPGVEMPIVERTSRQALLLDALALPYPIVIRPVGSHAGQEFSKCDDKLSIDHYLATTTGDTFFVSRFIDYRSTDGLYRKYRIVLIQGCPHLCHMAISSHWMIHYLNAGMSESSAKRLEEAECMQRFEHAFAARHAKALSSVYETFCLDYVGLDCAETLDGRLLIFELDSNMIIHAMDPIEDFAYKQDAMQRIFSAFNSLIEHGVHHHLENALETP